MYNGSSQVDCIKLGEESISIQRVKQCVNFSGSRPWASLFLAAFLAMQKNMAIIFLDLLVGICNIIYLYEFYLHT